MKYQYCPICGEKLPERHHGKYCKKCNAKMRRKKLLRTAIVLGVVAGASSITAGVIAAKTEDFKDRAVEYVKDTAWKKVKEKPVKTAAKLVRAGKAARRIAEKTAKKAAKR